MRSAAAGAALAGCALVLVACNSCKKEFWPGPKDDVPRLTGSPGTLQVAGRVPAPHTRILLTRARLATIKGLRDANAPTWAALAEHCDEAVKETLHGEYEAWKWGHATLMLAICHKVTQKPEYAGAAIKYFKALLDDKDDVGDGKGGDNVVHHDDGYGIRSHGWMGAIAYDWLFDAPGMDDALRKHAMDRFVTWTSWYAQKGYNHDEPISNYYIGYFGAVAFAGLAVEGHDARADDLRKTTEKMWNREIVPAYREKLKGGDFPEGWQYGDMVGAIIAFYAEAEATSHISTGGGAPPAPLYDELPWLRDTVDYHTHALWPDGKHVYDTGDWDDKPAAMTPHTLMALSLVLPPNDPQTKGAAFLARLAKPPEKADEWLWLQALADDPSRPREDPRKGPTSYLSKGTATVLARTDWSPRALWVGMSSASTLSDHQHLDAGHFEIVRGADPLIIDAGGYGSFSSLSHNVIVVAAEKKVSTYTPNQGTWSHTASIARFEDTGKIVYAQADYASAYNPSGFPRESSKRAVTRAERELVFSRTPVANVPESGRVVVYDRMTVTSPAYPVTWLLHGGPPPAIEGSLARFVSGSSTALVTTLVPAGASAKLVDETNNKEADRAFYTNKPPDGMKSVRVEIASPTGNAERRFLHAFVIGPKDKSAELGQPKPLAIEGTDVDGVCIDDEVYVFPQSGPHIAPAALAYGAPASASRHVIVGLAPLGKYALTIVKDGGVCKVSVGPGGDRSATVQGVMVVEINGCVAGR